MAAKQGKDPLAGPVPALNIERVYSTAIPAEELAQAYGVWKENQLDKEVWQVIDERTSVPAG